MTHIDGTRAPGTLLLDGATLDYLDGESLRTGRSPAELVRLIVTADAIARADAEIATSVDGGVPSLGRPGVVAGQGVTRPPAPTTFHRPIPHVHLLDGGPCLFGDRCGR